MNIISREAAISTVFKMCDACDTYDIFDYRDLLLEAFKVLPSAQPEQPTGVQDILQYLDEYLHPIVSPEHWSVYSELHDMVSMLPSAQSEIKPIDYSDCANAMLKMWMDDVVTDGEYYKIMDKLNKFELKRREENDRKDDKC